MKLALRPLLGRKERGAILVLAVSVSTALACASANENPSAGPAGECASCHMSEYEAVRHPVHVGTKPTTCGICHNAQAWHPSKIDHPWPLTGAHASASCFFCHTGSPPLFRGTSKECVGCHRKDYDTSPFPGHSRFPTTCADCHSTAAWKPATRPTPETASVMSAPEPDVREPSKSDAPVRLPSPHSSVPVPTVQRPTPKPAPTPRPPVPDGVSGASPRRRGR